MAQNYVLLETIQLSQTATSVNFDNLPTSGYTDLKIVMSARITAASVQTTVVMNINGLSSGYADKYLYGSGTVAGSGSFGTSAAFIGDTPAANATANTFGVADIYIPNYRSSSSKSFQIESVAENNATAAFMEIVAASNSTTSPITDISFTPSSGSFVAGSSFSLYAVASLGTTPVTAPFASGGNIVANDGTYWYHAFLSSGTFTPLKNLSCDVLVIAGGGGAGAYGGGGGAGGLLLHSAQSLIKETNYTCTVGAGGAGGVYSTPIKGTNGGNSQFGSLTLSAGGGGGGTTQNANPGSRVGLAGGSSGGSGASDGGYGTVSSQSPSPSGQGFGGGDGSSQTYGMGGGGGGGAGGAGVGGTYSTPATGGVGVSTYSSWGVATSTGQNISGTRWYAGGGGGYANYGSGGSNPGGNGGGGAGDGNNGPVSPGIANTGGGGGATTNPGSLGGSGLIIVRYPMV